MKKSEFGMGCAYNLGLFLAHEGRIEEYKKNYGCEGQVNRAYSMWFYGASDHLFELQIPENISASLKRRLEKFQSRCLGWRLPINDEDMATKESFIWAIKEAKTLLRLLDKNVMNVKTIKGDWE